VQRKFPNIIHELPLLYLALECDTPDLEGILSIPGLDVNKRGTNDYSYRITPLHLITATHRCDLERCKGWDKIIQRLLDDPRTDVTLHDQHESRDPTVYGEVWVDGDNFPLSEFFWRINEADLPLIDRIIDKLKGTASFVPQTTKVMKNMWDHFTGNFYASGISEESESQAQQREHKYQKIIEYLHDRHGIPYHPDYEESLRGIAIRSQAKAQLFSAKARFWGI
jgi:hypothetical protein